MYHHLRGVLFYLLLFFAATLSSQSLKDWTYIGNELTYNGVEFTNRKITPNKYLTYRLDTRSMRAQLASAPLWQDAIEENDGVVLILPMPDGKPQRFRIVEAPVMHPDLQAKYPEIRTYAGIGIDDPAAYFRGDFTLFGFHGMIRSPEHSTVYIDPLESGNVELYQVYYKRDFSKSDPWDCGVQERLANEAPAQAAPAVAEFFAGDCVRRTYVLALSCTGEYATFHGGTVPLVLSAYNTTMARVNGVFETEMSVTMTLHPNTNMLIFLNAATDPFTNGSGGAMLTENQTTCDNIIGNANYDIGHVFSTGGGGVAYLGSLCNSTTKAGGVTGQANPIGDPFDIDYVAHEMGHQFGANHTQNNACNRSAAAAHEPGSASTIMGYAGICAPNVQNNSDDYFHAHNLLEMSNEVTSGVNGAAGNGGNTCSTNSVVNSAPNANAGADYVIPKSTPFILTGSGSDPNGHALTYTWEQMDPAVATMPPVSTNTGGPTFRSFKGTANPSRYLPRLQDVINNASPTWEVLPSVGRTLNFRLTVRDNFVGGGCHAEDNMVVTVDGTAGPFVVTAPNTAVSFLGASTQTVTWNIAGTDAAPVSCANVDILLSTDGGFTYPYTLATATPNDGTQTVLLPNIGTTTARVMVRANGNIFYDISNTNFTITAVAEGFVLSALPSSQTVCKGTDAQFTVSSNPISGFSGSIALTASGLPPGATANFSPSTIPSNGSSTLTINTNNATTGTYTVTITGTSGSTVQSTTVSLTVNPTNLNTPTPNTPINAATNISITPTLNWNTITGASSYQLEVSTSSTFTSTVISQSGITTPSFTVSTPLNNLTTYFWRVRATNPCVNSAWSTVFQFTTTPPPPTAVNYGLTISTGAYQSIATTGTSVSLVGNDVAVNITGLSPAITISGTSYTSVRMSSNGWLALYSGTAPTSTNNYAVLSSDVPNAAVILAPMHADLITSVAGTTAARRQTIGSVHIFEWINYSRYNATSANRTDLLNFQVRINASTGEIVFAYGNTTISPNLTLDFQVGLRIGTTLAWSTHINNLQINPVGSPTSATWADAVTGNAATSTMYLRNANPNLKPPSGLTYTFTPNTTLAPVRTFSPVTNLTETSATMTWSAASGATQYNLQYRISGSVAAWTNFSGNPVTGTSATITGLTPNTKYQVRVQASNGTNNAIWSHIPTSAGGTGDDGYSTNQGTFTTLDASVLTLSQTFIQGYMDGSSGVMRPVMLNAVNAGGTVPGQPAPTATECDLITVELRASTAPYAVVQTKTVVLNTNGTASTLFPTSVIGNNYYLVVKGRNILETWSAAPITFASSTAYNFGATTQAFGNNLGMVGSVPVIYSGDLNTPTADGHIDLLDYPTWENPFSSALNGYLPGDLNGDGLISPLDYPIWEANYSNFVSRKRP